MLPATYMGIGDADCRLTIGNAHRMPIGFHSAPLRFSVLRYAAAGSDGVTPTDVKNIKEIVAPLLCHLINCIMKEGIYPEVFKESVVVAINKTGKTTDPDDYRPVSLLTTYNKIIEK